MDLRTIFLISSRSASGTSSRRRGERGNQFPLLFALVVDIYFLPGSVLCLAEFSDLFADKPIARDSFVTKPPGMGLRPVSMADRKEDEISNAWDRSSKRWSLIQSQFAQHEARMALVQT